MNIRLASAMLAAFGLAAAMPAQAADNELMMATTTSTQDSGLLEFLEPTFKQETGISLKWVAVGTGKALEIAKNCDADVLLVHAPAAEKKFVEEGHGIDRRQIMYNDFVIVGPAADPAKVKGKPTADALKAIFGAKAGFVSRGDQSGTHKAEMKLWKQAGIEPDKDEKINATLGRAWDALDAPDTPRDGEYAFVASKCAPAFSYYGWFFVA